MSHIFASIDLSLTAALGASAAIGFLVGNIRGRYQRAGHVAATPSLLLSSSCQPQPVLDLSVEQPRVLIRKRKISLVDDSIHKRPRTTREHEPTLAVPETHPLQYEQVACNLQSSTPRQSHVSHSRLGLVTPAASSDGPDDRVLHERSDDDSETSVGALMRKGIESTLRVTDDRALRKRKSTTSLCTGCRLRARVTSCPSFDSLDPPAPSAPIQSPPAQRQAPLKAHESDGYQSGASASHSALSDSDLSYHEGSDASSYDSRAESSFIVISDTDFYDGSDADSDD